MSVTRKRILIADCNEDVLLSLEWMLEEAGFDTTTAWSGHDALSLVHSQAFDLILLGDHLADSRCEEILQELQNKHASTGCILMQPSRTASPELAAALQYLGACDSVYKHGYSQIVNVVVKYFNDRAAGMQVA
jgi:DNA-binding response OmpR family regulator